jgi:hypothetical protein
MILIISILYNFVASKLAIRIYFISVAGHGGHAGDMVLLRRRGAGEGDGGY